MNFFAGSLAATAVVPAAAALPVGASVLCASEPFDTAAALARAEQMIEILRTRHVCEGWHGHGLDETAAARALAYFRNWAAGGEDNVDEWMAVVKFLGDHGQSIDWIVLGDPGALISGAAGRSARAAMLSVDPEIDPIFALIAEARRSCAAHSAACEISGAIVPGPAFDEANAVTNEAENRQYEALNAVLYTDPITLAGVIALLEYLGSPLCEDDPTWSVLSFALGWYDDGDDEHIYLLRLPATIADTLHFLTTLGGAP
jgi:hypothetical protein